jgi:1,4-dihydroxy-2-naphthoate polyprenyltransferase
MRLAMWKKALQVIPSVSSETWKTLDLVSRWLISARAAVIVMTFLSSALAGLFAVRDGGFRFLPWLVMTVALCLGHGSNNLFNDYTDWVRGVDKDNYFRTQYGPQPVAHGLMTTRQLLVFFGVTLGIVVGLAVVLCGLDGWDPMILVLLAVGAAFVLLYTWPLKYLGLGELSVLFVWGPLMIGGGYYALTRQWSPMVLLASAPYALVVTTVIFGKHIDKADADRARRIRTLPVLMGERAARALAVVLLLAPFVIVGVLIGVRYFTPALAVVVLAVPALVKTLPAFFKPRPAEKPEGFPDGQGGWPLYFAPIAFVYTRAMGTWFLLGVAGEAALRILAPGFWR